ncbi:MAG: glycosyltransferase family 2 protein [Clostridia bacterium]|nr:glycosyltransferase family 2 protein [Clostridia bacterium]
MSRFDIPVVLFIFKRDKAVDIVHRIAEIQPKKLYILADQGRNDEERVLAEECRKKVEAAITWDCEVIKNYADENRGVYQNIGQGAIWVLKREKWAIFLEDDNLPELSFFPFCKEMLEKYQDDERILWICGTNYLGDYTPKSGHSYVFTRHMLPCGWASWSHKFERFYDGDLALTDDAGIMDRIGSVYCNKKVYKQYKRSWMSERARILRGERPVSWDYQMDFSIKAHELYGICPCKNQIKNIGVDSFSVHGGTDLSLVMTQRFCGMDSYSLSFPLNHPEKLAIDPVFEKKIGKIILYPLRLRIRVSISRIVRAMLGVPQGKSIKNFIKEGFKK